MAKSRIGILAVLLVGLLIGVVSIWLGLAFFAGPSLQDLEELGDRLSPPNSWHLIASRELNRTPFCFSDSPCPSLHRSWSFADAVTTAELREMMEGAGWQVTDVHGDCAEVVEFRSTATLCRARASLDGIPIELAVIPPRSDETYTAVLSIRP